MARVVGASKAVPGHSAPTRCHARGPGALFPLSPITRIARRAITEAEASHQLPGRRLQQASQQAPSTPVFRVILAQPDHLVWVAEDGGRAGGVCRRLRRARLLETVAGFVRALPIWRRRASVLKQRAPATLRPDQIGGDGLQVRGGGVCIGTRAPFRRGPWSRGHPTEGPCPSRFRSWQ